MMGKSWGGFNSLQSTRIRAGETVHTIAIDLDEAGRPALTRLDDIELEHGHSMVERFRIRDGDPLSAEAEVRHETLFRRAGWSACVRTHARLTSTRDAFLLDAELEAFEGERRVFEREWKRSIPRDML